MAHGAIVASRRPRQGREGAWRAEGARVLVAMRKRARRAEVAAVDETAAG